MAAVNFPGRCVFLVFTIWEGLTLLFMKLNSEELYLRRAFLCYVNTFCLDNSLAA